MRWWVVREDGKGEGDGEIVAWAKWVVPHEIGAEERKSGEIGGWPEGANVELCEEFFGKLREGRRRWVGEGEYCEFLFLCSGGSYATVYSNAFRLRFRSMAGLRSFSLLL